MKAYIDGDQWFFSNSLGEWDDLAMCVMDYTMWRAWILVGEPN